ncbi:MAG: hypothetical protein JWO40_740 [Candidatus Doudnabacteria bacterium]|nr:hypothetical protein [Candidatus Doudnabacteria bacterium]
MENLEYIKLTEEYKKVMHDYHDLLKEFFTETTAGTYQEATKFFHRKEDAEALQQLKAKRDEIEKKWFAVVQENQSA